MGVSTAFKELSEALARLESSGTDIQHAAVNQDVSDPDTSVTADLTVTVPLPTAEETGGAVSIEATDASVKDGRVAAELTVTASGTPTGTGSASDLRAPVDAPDGSTPASLPAYKDSEALEAAYEQYDTFPEMTDALGVDVTPETVRRNMIKYDIHDPKDTTPESRANAVARGSESTPAADDSPPPADGTPESSSAPTRGGSSAAASTDPEGVSERQSESELDPHAESGSQTSAESEPESSPQSAVTDGGSATTADASGEGQPRTHRPVDDVLTEPFSGAESGTRDGGLDLPEGLTVGDLTDAVNRSRTVHEAARQTGLSQSTARRLLQVTDLIHFVSRSLAADQVTVSSDEVVRRLTADT